MIRSENDSVNRPDESPGGMRSRRFLTPSVLATIFTALVIGLMVALSSIIIYEYRALQIHSHGQIGSAFIDDILAPLALTDFTNGGFSGADPKQVFMTFDNNFPDIVMRTWDLDGVLRYSTLPLDSAALHEEDGLQSAAQGNFTVALETSGPADPNFPLAYPFFEIYAPIHDPATGAVIAVGEIYLDAADLLRDRAFVETTIRAAVIVAATSMLGMLALTFKQSSRLVAQLSTEREITRQNDQLRREAIQARLYATQANEQVLNTVGADLHDGPVQLLGLASLLPDDPAEANAAEGTSQRELISQALADLRSISAGLILPELEELDTKGVIALAVERHTALRTGTVNMDILSDLPELELPRKICLYRLICEGLGNAARHGKCCEPCITVEHRPPVLDIVILGGASQVSEVGLGATPLQLGLQGMRRRLDAFGGRISLNIDENRSRLHVTLPVQSTDDQVA